MVNQSKALEGVIPIQPCKFVVYNRKSQMTGSWWTFYDEVQLILESKVVTAKELIVTIKQCDFMLMKFLDMWQSEYKDVVNGIEKEILLAKVQLLSKLFNMFPEGRWLYGLIF